VPGCALLRTQGIVLDLPGGARLPAASSAVRLLSVRLQAPDGASLVAALFRGRPVRESRFPAEGPAQAETYQTASERLDVLRIGVVQYKRLAPPVTPGPVGAAAALREADAFVRRLGGLPVGARFDYAAPVPGSPLYEVRYVEVYRGLPLFPGYIEVDVDADGVAMARRYWLDVSAPRASPPRPTIPAAQALLQIAARVHASGTHPMRVVGVDLGYYSQSYVAARQWQLFPVWRVRLAGGGVSYVNAYTGALEE
jgi:hypothetical protein